MSALQQQRKVVEQLRREATNKRVNVSIAVEDLKVKRSYLNEVDYNLICFILEICSRS